MSIRQNAEDPRTVRRRGIRPHSETITPSQGVVAAVVAQHPSAKRTMLAVVPPPSTPSETPKVAEPAPKAPEAQRPRIDPKKTMLGLPPAPSATPAEPKPITTPTAETKTAEPAKKGPPPPPRRDGNFNDSIVLVPIEDDAPNTTPGKEDGMQFRNCSTNGLGTPPKAQPGNPDGVSEQTRAAEKALRDSIKGISGAPAPGDVTPAPRGSQPDEDPEALVKTRAMDRVRHDGDLIMSESVQIELAEDALELAKKATAADVDSIRNHALRKLESDKTAKAALFIYRHVIALCDQRFPRPLSQVAPRRASDMAPPRRISSAAPLAGPLPPPPNPPSIPGRSPARHSSPPPARPPMPSDMDPNAPLPHYPGATGYFENPVPQSQRPPIPVPSIKGTKVGNPPPAGTITAPEIPDEPSVAEARLPPPPTTPSVRTAKRRDVIGVAFDGLSGMTHIVTDGAILGVLGSLSKEATRSSDPEALRQIRSAVTRIMVTTESEEDPRESRTEEVIRSCTELVAFISGKIQALGAPPPPPATPTPKARKNDRGPMMIVIVCIALIIAASVVVYSIPTPPQAPDASESVWGN